MKLSIFILCGLTLIGLSSAGLANGGPGVLGLNYTLGPSFILGGDGARDAGSVQPGVGTALQLGLTRNADFEFNYDYLHADMHTQALTFGGRWRFSPDSALSPFAGAGIGFGKPFAGEGWDHFSLKLSAGVEKALTSDISLAGVMSYQYVDGTDPIGSVHSLIPGVRLIYYFAHLSR